MDSEGNKTGGKDFKSLDVRRHVKGQTKGVYPAPRALLDMRIVYRQDEQLIRKSKARQRLLQWYEKDFESFYDNLMKQEIAYARVRAEETKARASLILANKKREDFDKTMKGQDAKPAPSRADSVIDRLLGKEPQPQEQPEETAERTAQG